MKIEKISDTQIKFILNHADLLERNIKIDELVTPSDKTQELFRDIMEQAMEECGFSADNTPLMVEAVPVAFDGIMIIVTKLDSSGSSASNENKFTMVSQGKDIRRYKRKTISHLASDPVTGGSLSIFSFNTLDDVIGVCVRLYGCFHGSNSLYKMREKYYLILQNDLSADSTDMEDIELVLGEYGQKHVSTTLSKFYIIEHGEKILQDSAIKTLAKNFA